MVVFFMHFHPPVVTPKTLKGFGDPTQNIFQKRKDRPWKTQKEVNLVVKPL